VKYVAAKPNEQRLLHFATILIMNFACIRRWY